jgi:hypothetical protein
MSVADTLSAFSAARIATSSLILEGPDWSGVILRIHGEPLATEADLRAILEVADAQAVELLFAANIIVPEPDTSSRFGRERPQLLSALSDYRESWHAQAETRINAYVLLRTSGSAVDFNHQDRLKRVKAALRALWVYAEPVHPDCLQSLIAGHPAHKAATGQAAPQSKAVLRLQAGYDLRHNPFTAIEASDGRKQLISIPGSYWFYSHIIAQPTSSGVAPEACWFLPGCAEIKPFSLAAHKDDVRLNGFRELHCNYEIAIETVRSADSKRAHELVLAQFRAAGVRLTSADSTRPGPMLRSTAESARIFPLLPSRVPGSSEDAVEYLPVTKPSRMRGEWGEPFSWTPHNVWSAPTVLMTGVSGSGLTFSSNEFAISNLLSGNEVWTVRMDHSKVFDDALNAQAQLLDINAPAFSLNLFSIVDSAVKFDAVSGILGQWLMALSGLSDKGADKGRAAKRRQIVQHVLREVWEQQGASMGLKHVLEALRALPIESEIAAELATSIESRIEGLDSAWFEGKAELEGDYRSFVAGYRMTPANSLLAMTLLTIFSIIFEHPSKPRLLVLDSLDLLPNEPNVAWLMAIILRRCRQRMMAVVITTRPISSLEEESLEAEVFHNSGTFIVRKNSFAFRGLLERLEGKEQASEIDDRISKRGRAWMWLKMPSTHRGYILEHKVDPISETLCSHNTAPRAVMYLELRAQGKSVIEALQQVATAFAGA